MPRSDLVASAVDIWEVRLFGGPRHNTVVDLRDGADHFYATEEQPGLSRLSNYYAPRAIHRYEYTVVHNRIVNRRGDIREIRCGLCTEQLSREELLDYRDYLHVSLREFDRPY